LYTSPQLIQFCWTYIGLITRNNRYDAQLKGGSSKLLDALATSSVTQNRAAAWSSELSLSLQQLSNFLEIHQQESSETSEAAAERIIQACIMHVI